MTLSIVLWLTSYLHEHVGSFSQQHYLHVYTKLPDGGMKIFYHKICTFQVNQDDKLKKRQERFGIITTSPSAGSGVKASNSAQEVNEF